MGAVTPAPDGGYPNENTAEGTEALDSLSPGKDNTAIGFEALRDNTGNFNTATGSKALNSNTDGGKNTATGYRALLSNTGGGNNTAIGFEALRVNDGSFNTATGSEALNSNTNGTNNTATGYGALSSNTGGGNNTANGMSALQNNITGISNTATGFDALQNNTTGGQNTATGNLALQDDTTGSANTATGYGALGDNTTSSTNTAIGYIALSSNTTGSGNIALGSEAGQKLTTGNNNIDIGNIGVADESGTIRIGATGTQTATFVAGISGVTVASGVGVIVGTDGHLGTVTSSARFKEAIRPMDQASEAILALKPVTFRYKRELDPEGIPQFGLVAEEVEKVNPDLVARDSDGRANTVRYEAVNAMLLNEFLKEHDKVQELEAAIARQQDDIKALVAGLKEQALQIQKMRGQFGANQPAQPTGG